MNKVSASLFANLAFRLPWQPMKFSGVDKIYLIGRELLKNHFCFSVAMWTRLI